MNEETANEKEAKGFKVLWRVFLIVCAVLVAGCAVWRIFFNKKKVEISPLPTVEASAPVKGDVKKETSLIATKMPGDIYYVIPMTAGKVKKIYVEAGDKVNKGDKICEIDNSKQIDGAKIQLDSAQLQIDSINDSIELAKTNLDRMKALYSSGDISAQNYEQVKSSYDQAVSGLEGAKLQYEAAKLQYDTQVEFATVTAPASGVVESTNMTLDNYVSQSGQVAVISGQAGGKLQFNITDRLLPSVKAGDEIRAEKQGQEYICKVTEVSTFPGQTTGLYQVQAQIDDDGVIATGSGVKVFFTSSEAKDCITVPEQALYYDGGHTYVYTVTFEEADDEGASVLSGNKAATVHKVEVTTGLSDGGVSQIIEGISTEDLVITTWTSQLYEGARVQVLGGAA